MGARINAVIVETRLTDSAKAETLHTLELGDSKVYTNRPPENTNEDVHSSAIGNSPELEAARGPSVAESVNHLQCIYKARTCSCTQ